MKLLMKWQMPFKERIKYTLALICAVLFCILGIVLGVTKFNKDISAIIICSLIILFSLFFILILNNRKTLIYENKVVYVNVFGLKKTLKGNVSDLFILIHNKKHNKIYLTASFKGNDEKLNARIMYNDVLREELKELNIKHDVMLNK